jgi:PKD repeat protein
VHVGEEVVFRGEWVGIHDSVRQQYPYVFIFGDQIGDKLETNHPAVRHTFWSVGKHTVSLTLRQQYYAISYVATVPRDSMSITVDSLSLLAVPETATVGQMVTFTVDINGVNTGKILYRIRFGDKRDGGYSSKPSARHSYLKQGTFIAQADLLINGTILATTRGRQVLVVPKRPPKDVPPPDRVKLLASTYHGEVGDTIRFTAITNKPHKNMKYRFIFGDGEPSAWTHSSVMHAYKTPGYFSASVEAMSGGEKLVPAEAVVIEIDPHSPLWPYPVALLVGGFLAWNLLPFPRLGVRARPGRIQLSTGEQKKPAVHLEILLKPNLGNGTYSFPHPPVITNERRTHG